MLKLRNKSFKIITENLKEKARPIDRERYNYHFNDDQPEKLIEEIKKHQNQDGGFGNALEPDFRLPLSTPMATSIALRYLKNIDNQNSAEEIIKKTITYLENNAELLKDYNGNKLIGLVAFNGEDYYSVPGQMAYIRANQDNLEIVDPAKIIEIAEALNQFARKI